MRILIISRGIPTDKNPMWGNFEFDQAKALADRGHEVVMMAIDRRVRRIPSCLGLSKSEKHGVVMYDFYFPLPNRVLSRKSNNYIVDTIARRMYKEINKIHGTFDVIHAHYLPNICMASKLGDNKSIVIGTEHWSELKREKIRKNIRLDASEAYPKLDRLIVVSHPLQKIIKDNFDIDSVFVGCVIDDVFSYQTKVIDGIFRFVAVGSLFPIKGFDVLIKAFIYADFDENVQLHIIGEGHQRNKLQKIINSSDKKNMIFLSGRKSREEIMDMYSKSSVYVLSSHSENFATACLEAMSAGLPAIMTRCGGPEDFVDNSNSILVPKNDYIEMAKAMHYMYKNISKYDGKTISEDFRKKYSADAIVTQLESIYNLEK